VSAFLFAFAAVIVTSIGSRDQMLIAGLAERLARPRPLLSAAWLAAVLSALAMAWAGAFLTALMPPAASAMLIAIALLLAAVELLLPSARIMPKEPTRSLGAVLLVLLARQLGDAPRFVIFALAVAAPQPLLAGAGGALGGGAALTIGWLAGDGLAARVPLRAVRPALAAVLAALAITIGLFARGILA